MRALLLDAAGRAREAANALEPALAGAGPEGDSLRVLLARMLFHAGTIESRAEAARLYEKVLFRHPDDVAVRREYAYLQDRRGFHYDALHEYKRILRRRPDDAGAALEVARFHVAYWKRSLSDESLRDATAAARRAAVPDTAEAARFLLATLLTESDRTPEARAMLDSLSAAGARDPRVDLLRGSCALRLGRAAEAESLFLIGLERLSDSTRAVYDDVSVLTDSVGVHAARRTFGESDSLFREAMWKEYDPTYATRLNERRIEQWDRVLWSDLLFGDPARGIAGWTTEPGVTWVRYGRPRLWTYGVFPARWEWTYQIERDLHTIRFLDRFLNGGFALEWPPTGASEETLEENLASRLGGANAWYREPASRVFPIEIDGSVLYAGGAEPWIAVATGVAAPPDTSRLSSGARRRARRAAAGPFERQVAVFDTLWRHEAAWTDTVRSARVWPTRRGVAVATDSVPTTPGRHLVAVTLRDLASGAHGDALLDIEVPRRQPGEIAISSLVPAWQAVREPGAPAEALHRPGGFAVIPNPLGRIADDEPLVVYFEIYRAAAETPQTPVDITYRIEAVRTRRGLFGRSPVTSVSNTVQDVARGVVDGHSLEIDVTRLTSGVYNLTLAVRDPATGDVASSEIRFEKVNLGSASKQWTLARDVD